MSFCCLRKLCMMQKQVIWSLVSIFFDSHELSIQWKQIVQNFRLFIQIYTDFKFFRKWSENICMIWVCMSCNPHFMYDLSEKLFLMLYFINWLNAIVWLSLVLEILCNMYIKIVCFPDCDVMNFDINLVFLIQPSFDVTRNSSQKFKYFGKEKSSEDEIKSTFPHFQRNFSDQKLSQTWGCTLKAFDRFNRKQLNIL